MKQELLGAAAVYIVVFCRFGAALILLPGLSGIRIPMTVRIFMALLISFAITPLMFDQVKAAVPRVMATPALVWTELIIGLAFGFWCFCFLHASRFAAHIISSSVGLAGIPGQPIEESEPSNPLATLMSLGATALILSSNLHLLSLEALSRSYISMPALELPAGRWLAENSTKLIRETSVLAIQISSPFIVLAVVTNLALGLCGKFTPQLQIYFALMGLTILLSLLLLAWLYPGMSRLPVEAYGSWLSGSVQ